VNRWTASDSLPPSMPIELTVCPVIHNHIRMRKDEPAPRILTSSTGSLGFRSYADVAWIEAYRVHLAGWMRAELRSAQLLSSSRLPSRSSSPVPVEESNHDERPH
jgi:hypothetical protein